MASPSKRELFTSNSWKTRSAADHVQAVRHLTLDSRHTFNFNFRQAEPQNDLLDWHMGSSATTFAKGGIKPGHGLKGTYVRDPHSGVWHKQGITNPLFLKQSRSLSTPTIPVADQVPMNHMSMCIKRQPHEVVGH